MTFLAQRYESRIAHSIASSSDTSPDWLGDEHEIETAPSDDCFDVFVPDDDYEPTPEPGDFWYGDQ